MIERKDINGIKLEMNNPFYRPENMIFDPINLSPPDILHAWDLNVVKHGFSFTMDLLNSDQKRDLHI